jgi:hypothetical protein
MHALQRRHLIAGLSARFDRCDKETAPARGGGERWGRLYIAVLDAGGPTRTQLVRGTRSGLVAMFCFEHLSKFSTACGLF